MASNYPTSLDNFTNPTVSDYLNSTTVPHATQHSDLNDAVENLQAKVGIDSSADTDSIDYKVTDAASRITTLEAGATADAVVAYADLSARTAANPSPSEGDVSWQEDTNRFDIYNGSAWSQVAVGGTYTDYSASQTFTNLTLGNGTVESFYTQVNDLVHFYGRVVWGSTTSLSGGWRIYLPVNSAEGAGTTTLFIGVGSLEDTGTTGRMGLFSSFSNNSITVISLNGTTGQTAAVNQTTPHTWAATDRMTWNIVYKAA
jgi:hypothetical protein